MARVRVRQHVNPLSQKYQGVMIIPALESLFARPTQPLHLDIGCARGKFLLQMAEQQPDWNFLGVEIRESLVIESNEQRDRLELSNLQFIFGNINSEPLQILAKLSPYLTRVSIQFPDPWFKTRHSKRRVAQPELVNALAQVLKVNDQVFLQSDVELVAQEMGDRFLENPHFQKIHTEQWLAQNPFPVATEREVACIKLERPIYRLLLAKISGD